MKDIAGTFETSAQAYSAYTQLLNAGFAGETISLLVSPEGRDRIFTGATTTEKGASDALKGAVAGAVGVGALGALVGALTAIVIGPGVLAAGPALVALSSAAGGAVVGGLSGALVEAGFSHDDVDEYAAALQAGKAVIVVHGVGVEREDIVRQIMPRPAPSRTVAA